MTERTQKRRIHQGWDDRLFDLIVNILVVLVCLIVLYPMYFVVLASISNPSAVQTGQVLLIPRDVSFSAYKHIAGDSRVWTGYLNTILYTFFGTLLGTILTVGGGYALSRKDLVGRNVIMKMMVFTMYFSGGLVPTYMVVRNLGLINTYYVLMILGSFSVYNLIITRTFFASKIPDELLEAARIDGCGNGRFFFQIVVPLSKEIIAVVVLYIAVYHWNSYFNALIYVSKPKYYPLQMFLREILVSTQSLMSEGADLENQAEMQRLAETIKYGVIIISSLPILILYPFLQRFFIRGVMIGSIKG